MRKHSRRTFRRARRGRGPLAWLRSVVHAGAVAVVRATSDRPRPARLASTDIWNG